LLHLGGRQLRVSARASEIRTALRAPQLEAAPLVTSAYGVVVCTRVHIVGELNTQVAASEAELTSAFEHHPRSLQRCEGTQGLRPGQLRSRALRAHATPCSREGAQPPACKRVLPLGVRVAAPARPFWPRRRFAQPTPRFHRAAGSNSKRSSESTVIPRDGVLGAARLAVSR
jgi:hypothetical protein